MQKKGFVPDVPLIVDMDGTFIKGDSLHEAFVQLSLKRPLDALRASIMLRHGRAAFKAAIADHVLPDVAMPIEETVVDAIKRARAQGRKVYLATAADRRFAEKIATSTGLFEGIFASENGMNLKGKAKADRMIAAFGMRGFDYIGNDTADIPVWRAARIALVAGASARKIEQFRSELPALVALNSSRRSVRAYASALRPEQWVKNALVVLPLIARPDFSLNALRTIMIAFMSFSLLSSSVYLVDDILNLSKDRAHPEKRKRSLASGVIPLSHGVGFLICVSMVSIALALLLPWTFMLSLLAYAGLSVGYSAYWKHKPLIDVTTLAALYGSRILAGSAATGISLSHWFVVICVCLFLYLAFIKRIAETVAQSASGIGEIMSHSDLRGRPQTIPALTAASGLVSVLVFALYLRSAEAQTLYQNPRLLWLNCLFLAYWLGRIYRLGGRGEIRGDPLVFVLTDWISLTITGLTAMVFLAAL